MRFSSTTDVAMFVNERQICTTLIRRQYKGVESIAERFLNHARQLPARISQHGSLTHSTCPPLVASTVITIPLAPARQAGNAESWNHCALSLSLRLGRVRVFENDLGYIIAEANAVIRPAILWINLGRIGQIEVFHRRSMIRDHRGIM